MATKTPSTPQSAEPASPASEALATGKKKPAPTGAFGEVGSYGLKQSYGYIFEEFLTELKGERGARFYREMADNSPVVGALLLGYREVAAHLDWDIEEGEEATPRDISAAKFVKECFYAMDQTWNSILAQALSELTFGWSYHEVVYKKRDDGRIGWSAFPIRSQESLVHWQIGKHGEIEGMVQRDPQTGEMYEIPMGKALLFRTTDLKNNPEGRSMLRPAVIPYQYVRRIQEFEAIGIERDLAGLPLAWVPSEWMNSEDPAAKVALANIVKMVADVRNNERSGIVLPMMYEPELTGAISRNKALDFELLSSAGGKAFDTDKILTRYNQQVAMSLLGDFVTLGHDGVGSYALGAVKMDLWVMVVDSICKGIAEVFNKGAIEKLLAINGIDYDHAPVLKYGQVENVDLAALNTFVSGLANAGLLTPDEDTEAWLREQAGMPPLNPDTDPIYDRAPVNPMTGLPIDEKNPVDLKTGLPVDPRTHGAPGLAESALASADAGAKAAQVSAAIPPEKAPAKKPAPKKA